MKGVYAMSTITQKFHLLESLALDNSQLEKILDKLLDHLTDEYQTKLTQYNQIIQTYEQRYQMNSKEFSTRFEQGILGDNMDWFEWDGYLHLRQRLQEKLKLTENHHV
ncbi:MAG: hypothetical protein R3E08_14345 [Thiotrichaceae bacterium]